MPQMDAETEYPAPIRSDAVWEVAALLALIRMFRSKRLDFCPDRIVYKDTVGVVVAIKLYIIFTGNHNAGRVLGQFRALDIFDCARDGVLHVLGRSCLLRIDHDHDL